MCVECRDEGISGGGWCRGRQAADLEDVASGNDDDDVEVEETEEDKINDAMLELEADGGCGSDDSDGDDDGAGSDDGGVVDLEDLGKAMHSGLTEAKLVGLRLWRELIVGKGTACPLV